MQFGVATNSTWFWDHIVSHNKPYNLKIQELNFFSFKGMQVRRFENDSELFSDEDFRESARSSPLPEALLCGDPCGDTMAVTAASSSSEHIDALACSGDGSNAPPSQEQCMDKKRKQTAERRNYRLGNNKVLPMECGNFTHIWLITRNIMRLKSVSFVFVFLILFSCN